MNRRFRLVSALGIAMVLATFMLYTALAGDTVEVPVVQARELSSYKVAKVATDQPVELVGVAAGPVKGTQGEHMTFTVTDGKGGHAIPVAYSGSVPDAFRVGRNVVVKGRIHGAGGSRVFRAVPGSLQTKCPSKFQSKNGSTRSSS
ncbi:MAG: cytochrome c maturation protein CcmE [Thermoleophilia bacterium]|nr:cytochrome c maturation protein CcmE [Thermoleophilia bacterium]